MAWWGQLAKAWLGSPQSYENKEASAGWSDKEAKREVEEAEDRSVEVTAYCAQSVHGLSQPQSGEVGCFVMLVCVSDAEKTQL
jgi:hypothetical protein